MNDNGAAAASAGILQRLLAIPDHRQAERLAGYFVWCTVGRGEALFRSGAAAEGCYLLVTGLLAVSRVTGFSDRSQIIALLRPETVVGEGALAGRGERSATVTAIEDSELLLLKSEEFRRLSEEAPPLALSVITYLLSISSRRLEKCSERLVHVL